MKFQSTLFALLLLSVTTFACSCDMEPDFKTKADLNKYSFIAHVKITQVNPAVSVKSPADAHQMSFELLELYKGEKAHDILVYGSHQSLGNWTSCDLGENVGEEWIVFGYMDEDSKQLMTGLCTRSRNLKKLNGYQELYYPNKLTLKQQLQRLFDKQPTEKKYDGLRTEYFPNGNKQVEENYEKGILNGRRTLWYPNEARESNQNYVNGKRNGKFEWFSEKGQLLKVEKFTNDIKTDTAKAWYPLDTSMANVQLYAELNNLSLQKARDILSTPTLFLEVTYDKNGEVISHKDFSQDGTKHIELLYFPSQNKRLTRYFHKNGALKAESVSVNNKETGLYKEWDQKGNVIKSWEYDDNGKVKQETIKRF